MQAEKTEMKKEEIAMADGRYLIFYTFEKSENDAEYISTESGDAENV